MINIHPRLASGIMGIIVIIISLLIEIIIKIQLFSDYTIYVFIFSVLPGIVFYNAIHLKYNRDRNNDTIMYIIGLLLVGLLVYLVYISSKAN